MKTLIDLGVSDAKANVFEQIKGVHDVYISPFMIGVIKEFAIIRDTKLVIKGVVRECDSLLSEIIVQKKVQKKFRFWKKKEQQSNTVIYPITTWVELIKNKFNKISFSDDVSDVMISKYENILRIKNASVTGSKKYKLADSRLKSIQTELDYLINSKIDKKIKWLKIMLDIINRYEQILKGYFQKYDYRIVIYWSSARKHITSSLPLRTYAPPELLFEHINDSLLGCFSEHRKAAQKSIKKLKEYRNSRNLMYSLLAGIDEDLEV